MNREEYPFEDSEGYYYDQRYSDADLEKNLPIPKYEIDKSYRFSCAWCGYKTNKKNVKEFHDDSREKSGFKCNKCNKWNCYEEIIEALEHNPYFYEIDKTVKYSCVWCGHKTNDKDTKTFSRKGKTGFKCKKCERWNCYEEIKVLLGTDPFKKSETEISLINTINSLKGKIAELETKILNTKEA